MVIRAETLKFGHHRCLVLKCCTLLMPMSDSVHMITFQSFAALHLYSEKLDVIWVCLKIGHRQFQWFLAIPPIKNIPFLETRLKTDSLAAIGSPWGVQRAYVKRRDNSRDAWIVFTAVGDWVRTCPEHHYGSFQYTSVFCLDDINVWLISSI